MSQGTLGGVPFDIDPESIAFHYDLKVSETNTVGGKVVQVYGTYLSNMNVMGSFGTGSWEAQNSFLTQISTQVNSQIGTQNNGQFTNGPPVRFTFPPRNWDFMVYILDYVQPGETTSVFLDNAIINYQWELTLYIDTDNGALTQLADATMLSYLSRLTAGVGWVPNTYNNVTIPLVSPTTVQDPTKPKAPKPPKYQNPYQAIAAGDGLG